MRRREFITVLGGAATWPLAARAQQTGKVGRIGILFGGFSDADPESQARIEAFTRQLQELGWIDGRNIKIDIRFGGGDDNVRRAYAEELIGRMPDVIVANSAPAVIALARQTKSIPIVFTSFLDPVGSGFAAADSRASFSRGLPSLTPRVLAAASAALVGSEVISASCCAKAARI